MKPITRVELQKLAEMNRAPCGSIYFPSYSGSSGPDQDRIRLKNLLGQAEERMRTRGLLEQETKSLLAPAQRIVQDAIARQGQIEGIALFLAPSFSRCYGVPVTVPELLVVTDRFHIKPLIPLLSVGEFFILALSQNEVRFFQASRFGINEVDLEDAPESLDQALRHDDPEKQLQFHTGTPKQEGTRAAIYHGHGAGADDAKTNILRFFRQVNDGVRELLAGEQAPLVFAGVDYLFPIYQKANSYPFLMDQSVAGNPEALRPEELREMAWTIVEPSFQQSRRDAVDQYRQLTASGQASCDLGIVAPAAHQGRVETLFVRSGVQKWGKFDSAAQEVQTHEKAEPGDEDLYDFAAVQTLFQGGKVFVVGSEEMPDDATIAAVFRY